MRSLRNKAEPGTLGGKAEPGSQPTWIRNCFSEGPDQIACFHLSTACCMWMRNMDSLSSSCFGEPGNGEGRIISQEDPVRHTKNSASTIFFIL